MNDEEEILEIEDEKIEKVEHVPSEFDNLKPRAELAEITKEDRDKFIKQEEKKEEVVVEEKEKTKESINSIFFAYGILITCIYFGISAFFIYAFIVDTLFSLGDLLTVTAIIPLLFYLLFIIVLLCPYFMLFKYIVNKKKKTYIVMVIYETIIILIFIIFLLFMWPAIQDSIKNNCCDISTTYEVQK